MTSYLNDTMKYNQLLSEATQRKIWKVARVDASLYTMNRASSTVYGPWTDGIPIKAMICLGINPVIEWFQVVHGLIFQGVELVFVQAVRVLLELLRKEWISNIILTIVI